MSRRPSSPVGTARTNRRTMLKTAVAGSLTVAGGIVPTSRAATNARPEASIRAQPAGTPTAASGDLHVFPRTGTRTASPGTEITLRGVTRAGAEPIIVIGSVSGGHTGILRDHDDGGGTSFVPDSPFDPGEEVTVEATFPLTAQDDGILRFTVGRPAYSREAPSDLVTDDPAAAPHAYRSRPDLLPPVFDITVAEEGTDEGLIFLGARVTGGQSGAIAIDDTGEPVWFSPTASRLDAHYDVRVQTWRGETVITFAEANARGPNGWRRGHYVIVDASLQRIAEFGIGNGYPGGDHHELLITERDTVLIGAYNPIHWDLAPFGGAEDGIAVDNVIQELEVSSGRVVFEWHSLDHIAIDESYLTVPTDPSMQFDYLHMNSIGLDPDGDLIMNTRHTFADYLIDRRTGDIIWRLNGKLSDFEMGDGTPFAWSHDGRIHDDGIVTLFDNATGTTDFDGESRGLMLQLDMEAMTATLVREYLHPDGIISVSQANVQMLPNGNAFVGWGSAPVFSEFDAEGNLLFNGRFPQGGTSYRAYRSPWSAQPARPPDVAAEADGEGMTVYASWNGATEVASWEVLAGADEASMEPMGEAERSGFETVIAIEAAAPMVAVRALDASGAELGASAPIEVG